MRKIIDISIIIPTHKYNNRLFNLSKLLTALENQRLLNDINFEIIVVNNGGYDPELESFVNKSKVGQNIKIIHEDVVGLSHARNIGVLHSKGKIIAFIDDDVEPSKNWLFSLVKRHELPKTLCVGGPVRIKNKNLNFPKWFSCYFLRFLIPPRFPQEFGQIVQPFYLIGANFAFKEAAFRKYGLFDTSLGRKGNCLLSGEDIEFMIRMKPKEIWFNPSAVVLTEIKLDRLSRKFFVKRIFWQAMSEARIAHKHGVSKLYDKKEILFSKEFVKIIIRSLINKSFFKVFCILERFIVFQFIFKIKKLL